MNAALIQAVEQTTEIETTGMQAAASELSLVELAYVGGGMANVAFM